jgi:hypothetical protein
LRATASLLLVPATVPRHVPGAGHLLVLPAPGRAPGDAARTLPSLRSGKWCLGLGVDADLQGGATSPDIRVSVILASSPRLVRTKVR